MLEKCAHTAPWGARPSHVSCGVETDFTQPCAHAISARCSEQQGNPQGTRAFPSNVGGGGAAWVTPLHKEASRSLRWAAWARPRRCWTGTPTYSPVCILCYVVCTMFLTQLGFLRNEIMNWDHVHMCRYKVILLTKTYLTILRGEETASKSSFSFRDKWVNTDYTAG